MNELIGEHQNTRPTATNICFKLYFQLQPAKRVYALRHSQMRLFCAVCMAEDDGDADDLLTDFNIYCPQEWSRIDKAFSNIYWADAHDMTKHSTEHSTHGRSSSIGENKNRRVSVPSQPRKQLTE